MKRTLAMGRRRRKRNLNLLRRSNIPVAVVVAWVAVEVAASNPIIASRNRKEMPLRHLHHHRRLNKGSRQVRRRVRPVLLQRPHPPRRSSVRSVEAAMWSVNRAPPWERRESLV